MAPGVMGGGISLVRATELAQPLSSRVRTHSIHTAASLFTPEEIRHCQSHMGKDCQQPCHAIALESGRFGGSIVCIFGLACIEADGIDHGVKQTDDDIGVIRRACPHG